MSYYVTGYIPAGDYGRMCDVCGRRRPGSKFKQVDGVWICDLNGYHNGYVPEGVLNRVPYVHTKGPQAIKDAKPFNPHDTFEAVEADLFNFLVGRSPKDEYNVTASAEGGSATDSVRSAAWSALYLYDIIAENRRPVRWVTLAKAKLRELADFLLTYQLGSAHVDSDITATIGTTGANDLEYGGFVTLVTGSAADIIGSVYSEDVGVGGLALLRAYQVLGDAKYRDGYLAALKCLRRMQCGGKLNTRYATTSLTGEARLHTGMWSHKLDIADLSATGARNNGCTDVVAGGQYERIVFGAPDHYGVAHDARFTINLAAEPANTDLITGHFPIDLRPIGGTRIRVKWRGIFTSEDTGGVTLTWRVWLLSDPSSLAGGTLIAEIQETPAGSRQILTYTSDIANPGLLTGIKVTVSTPVAWGSTNKFAYIYGWVCSLEPY